MEGLFLGGTLLAAFVSGAVALFAPCCIVVLFPAYLAAAVRNHRWRLVPLTFVFAAGVATVLVPVTLGFSLLTSSLLRYQWLVYGVGAVLLVVLAALAATGRTWSLPFLRSAPDLSRTDSGGVYALGVFSGGASACCAPVLAGVLTLSAVAPGLLAGTGIGLAYVFGMVFPLVLMTLAWDRWRPEGFNLGTRRVTWGFGSRRFNTTLTGMITAVTFLLLAAVLAVVAATRSSLAPTFLVGLGARIEDFLAPLLERLAWIPGPVVGLVLIAVAVGAVLASGRRRKAATSNTIESEDTKVPERSCHE